MTTTCLWAHRCPELNLCSSSLEKSKAAGLHRTSPKGHLGPVLAVLLNGAAPKATAWLSPSPSCHKDGIAKGPKKPQGPKAVAGDGRARRRQQGKMGRARVNNIHPNSHTSGISTAQRKAFSGLGLALARGPAAARGAPGYCPRCFGSPRNFSCQEGCGLRQEEERKKYDEGSQGFKRHINKNPPTQTNQGKSLQFVNHSLQAAQRLPSPGMQGKEPVTCCFATQRRGAACRAQSWMCHDSSWEGKQLPKLTAGFHAPLGAIPGRAQELPRSPPANACPHPRCFPTCKSTP